jgi:hypothetical protein
MRLLKIGMDIAWFLCEVLAPFWPPLNRFVLRVKFNFFLGVDVKRKAPPNVSPDTFSHIASILGPFDSSLLDDNNVLGIALRKAHDKRKTSWMKLTQRRLFTQLVKKLNLHP